MNIVESKRAEIQDLCQKNNIGFLGLFGSVARGDDTPNSDVDLLVKFNKPIGLLELVHAQNELSDALGRKVDLVTEGAVHPKIKPYIFKDLKTVYERT